MKYKIEGCCKSVVGNVRKNNEDNYFFNYKNLKEENEGSKLQTMSFDNTDTVVASVFDGMGGEEKGERASFLASSTLKEYIEDNTNKAFVFNDYIELANDKIVSEMTKGISMGTTVAAVLFSEKEINICNLGDSRIYGYKNGKLKQLSVDHTEENIQKKLNVSSGKKARLTQHLGIDKKDLTLVPYLNKYSYNKYEKILICSDGLTDMLSDTEIEDILKEDTSVKKNTQTLIDKALENGGIDNTTVMVFEIKKASSTDFKWLFIIGIILLFIVLLLCLFNKQEFSITKDQYTGPITVGDSYGFCYTGDGIIEFSNNNLKYKDGMVVALKEGNTVITIKNKNGEILYEKTIKVFPNN